MRDIYSTDETSLILRVTIDRLEDDRMSVSITIKDDPEKAQTIHTLRDILMGGISAQVQETKDRDVNLTTLSVTISDADAIKLTELLREQDMISQPMADAITGKNQGIVR